MSYDFDANEDTKPGVVQEPGMSEERYTKLRELCKKTPLSVDLQASLVLIEECLDEIERQKRIIEIDVAGSLKALAEIDSKAYFDLKREFDKLQKTYDLDMERSADGMLALTKENEKLQAALNRHLTSKAYLDIKAENEKLRETVELARDCFGYDGATVDQAIRDAHEALSERRTLRAEIRELKKRLGEK